jgi:hypothetical protein
MIPPWHDSHYASHGSPNFPGVLETTFLYMYILNAQNVRSLLAAKFGPYLKR